MPTRLIRVFLALAVAFVFTGRMEAAAQHCARLALAAEVAAPVAVADAAPCHGMHDEAAPATMADHSMHGAPIHGAKSPDRCECIAVLTCYLAIAEATASSHIEPYAWARPGTVTFASVELSPGLRPPRA
jgi:hypothetical protein